MPEDDARDMPVDRSRIVLDGRYASAFVRRVAVTLRLCGLDYAHVPLMPLSPDKTELANSIRSPGCRPCVAAFWLFGRAKRSVFSQS